MVLVCLICVLYLCVIAWYLNNMQIVVLGVVRPEMAMDFGSKEVELMLARIVWGDCFCIKLLKLFISPCELILVLLI